MSNGIKIFDTNINKISGPNCIYMLKPKLTCIKNMKKLNVTPPIFILFGDDHTNDKYQCINCSCENSKDCCYPIYSDKFLKLLDSLFSPSYPIDFFIENFDIGIKEDRLYKYFKSKSNKPLIKMRDDLLVCFHKLKKGKPVYKELCPTENIRWHFADTRMTSTSKINKKNKYFERILDLFSKYILFLFNETDDISEYLEEQEIFIENELSEDVSISYLNKIKYILNPEFYLHFEKNKNKSLIFKQIENMDDELKKYFQNIFKNYYINQYNLINESAKKLNVDILELENILVTIINFTIEIFKEQTKKNADYTKIGLNMSDYISRLDDKYKNFIKNNLNLHTPLLDLYFLSRSFKKPLNDKNSILNLSYFGSYHSSNISKFLINNLNYEIVYSKINKEDDKYRCLEIDSDVNLNKILTQYKNILENSDDKCLIL